MTVLWPIGRRGLGTMFVSGWSLVPRPPARITAVFNEASLKRTAVTLDEQLVSTVIGRSASLFEEDLREHGDEVKRRFAGSRVMVIGAAGSIGSAVVRQVMSYGPSMLSLVDPNENGLVELVREARSSRVAPPPDFNTHAIELGSIEFDHLLRATGPLDFVLNLAALKHVRSERDPFTLMRMLETNVLGLDAALALLATTGIEKVFSVSSDKAVNPTSLMGASKRWMERILVSHSARVPSSSARFANVAFSAGSLLEGFLFRLRKRQPIAAPRNVRRFFMSESEAAELCLLASALGVTNEIYVPQLSEAAHAVSLESIAAKILRSVGLEPLECSSEDEARSSPLLDEAAPSRWPCYFGETDTSGEKEVEELVGSLEKVDRTRYRTIAVVEQSAGGTGGLRDARLELERIRGSEKWDKRAIVAAVEKAVPEFRHVERGKSLDRKM
jgi:UDP-N-acetylglucosamine 4,6-dehydratase